jgi:hypothetical protein
LVRVKIFQCGSHTNINVMLWRAKGRRLKVIYYVYACPNAFLSETVKTPESLKRDKRVLFLCKGR